MVMTSSFVSTVSPLGTCSAYAVVVCVVAKVTSVRFLLSGSESRHAWPLDLRGELLQALSKHAIEGWERVDDIGERFQRSTELDRQHELAQDLTRTGSHQGRADQHTALAVGDQLQRATVKVMDVAARGLCRIGAGGDDIDPSGPSRRFRQTD